MAARGEAEGENEPIKRRPPTTKHRWAGQAVDDAGARVVSAEVSPGPMQKRDVAPARNGHRAQQLRQAAPLRESQRQRAPRGPPQPGPLPHGQSRPAQPAARSRLGWAHPQLLGAVVGHVWRTFIPENDTPVLPYSGSARRGPNSSAPGLTFRTAPPGTRCGPQVGSNADRCHLVEGGAQGVFPVAGEDGGLPQRSGQQAFA